MSFWAAVESPMTKMVVTFLSLALMHNISTMAAMQHRAIELSLVFVLFFIALLCDPC
jgi:hypothetical protein